MSINVTYRIQRNGQSKIQQIKKSKLSITIDHQNILNLKVGEYAFFKKCDHLETEFQNLYGIEKIIHFLIRNDAVGIANNCQKIISFKGQ